MAEYSVGEIIASLGADITDLIRGLERAEKRIENYKKEVDENLDDADSRIRRHSASLAAVDKQLRSLRNEGLGPTTKQWEAQKNQVNSASRELQKLYENNDIGKETYRETAYEIQGFNDTLESSIKNTKEQTKADEKLRKLREDEKSQYQRISKIKGNLGDKNIERMEDEKRKITSLLRETRKYEGMEGVGDPRTLKQRSTELQRMYKARNEQIKAIQHESKSQSKLNDLRRDAARTRKRVEGFDVDLSNKRVNALKEEKNQLSRYLSEARKYRDEGVFSPRQSKQQIGRIHNLINARDKQIKSIQDERKEQSRLNDLYKKSAQTRKRVEGFDVDLRNKRVNAIKEEKNQLNKLLNATRKYRDEGVLDEKNAKKRIGRIYNLIGARDNQINKLKEMEKKEREVADFRKQMQSQWKIGETAEELKEQQREAERMQKTLRKLKGHIPDKEYDRWNKSLANLSGRIKTANKAYSKHEGALDRIFRKYNNIVGATTRQIHLYGILAGVVGAVTAAYAGLGALAVREVAKLEEASDRIGVGIEKLQKYQFSLGMVGLTSRETRDSLSELSSTVYDAVSGSNAAKEAFTDLGISMSTLKQEGGDVSGIFDKVTKKLGSIKNISRRQGIAEQIFGKDAGRRIAAISGNIQELNRTVGELGIVLNEGVANKAEMAWKSITALWNVLKNKFMKAAAGASGRIEQIALHFVTLLNTSNIFKDTIVPTINTTIKLFKALYAAVKPLVILLQVSLQHITALKAVLSAIAGLVLGKMVIAPLAMSLKKLIPLLVSAVSSMWGLVTGATAAQAATRSLSTAIKGLWTSTGIGALVAVGTTIASLIMSAKAQKETEERIGETTNTVKENIKEIMKAKEEAQGELEKEMKLNIDTGEIDKAIDRLKKLRQAQLLGEIGPATGKLQGTSADILKGIQKISEKEIGVSKPSMSLKADAKSIAEYERKMKEYLDAKAQAEQKELKQEKKLLEWIEAKVRGIVNSARGLLGDELNQTINNINNKFEKAIVNIKSLDDAYGGLFGTHEKLIKKLREEKRERIELAENKWIRDKIEPIFEKILPKSKVEAMEINKQFREAKENVQELFSSKTGLDLESIRGMNKSEMIKELKKWRDEQLGNIGGADGRGMVGAAGATTPGSVEAYRAKIGGGFRPMLKEQRNTTEAIKENTQVVKKNKPKVHSIGAS